MHAVQLVGAPNTCMNTHTNQNQDDGKTDGAWILQDAPSTAQENDREGAEQDSVEKEMNSRERERERMKNQDHGFFRFGS